MSSNDNSYSSIYLCNLTFRVTLLDQGLAQAASTSKWPVVVDPSGVAGNNFY